MMEPEAPAQVEALSLATYLEVMSKAVFQTGISWQVVDKKWPGIKEAFHDFDPITVADFAEPELDALVTDPRVIRNHKKLQAIVLNARKMLELDSQYGGFLKYLRSHGGFEETVKSLRKNFKFLGESGCYYFLWVTKEEVPPYREWAVARGMRIHT